MILADTSVWIEHFRSDLPDFSEGLSGGEVVMHPFVLGELMLSGVYRRREQMRELHTLAMAPLARPEEVAHLIETRALDGRGIGFVDAALLASTLLQPGLQLLTLDRRLAATAAEFGVAVPA